MFEYRWIPALVMGLLLAACQAGPPSPAAGSAAAGPTSVGASTSATREGDPDTKPLGTFTDRNGFKRAYVLVRPGISDAELLELARRLHARDPAVRYWFMDSDSKIRQLLESLPRTEHGDNSTFPVDYVQQHAVAHLQLNIGGAEGSQWILARGAGSEAIATL